MKKHTGFLLPPPDACVCAIILLFPGRQQPEQDVLKEERKIFPGCMWGSADQCPACPPPTQRPTLLESLRLLDTDMEIEIATGGTVCQLHRPMRAHTAEGERDRRLTKSTRVFHREPIEHKPRCVFSLSRSHARMYDVRKVCSSQGQSLWIIYRPNGKQHVDGEHKLIPDSCCLDTRASR